MSLNFPYANLPGYDQNGLPIASGVAFKPSSYTGDLVVTDTVTGQSVAIATGVGQIRFKNKGPTNFVKVAFGINAADAESNASAGVEIDAGVTEYLGVPAQATHFAYVADTGAVTINVQQGI